MGGNLFHCPQKIGCTPETLRVWVRQHERDTGGGDGGLTTAERQRLKELERENRELRRSNDILRQGFRLFCEGGVRPPLEKMMPLLDKLREQYGGRTAMQRTAYCPVNVLPLSATATSSG